MGATASTVSEASAAEPRDPATAGRLGEVLVHLEKVSPQTVQKALKLQSELTGRLGTNLLELGAIHEGTLLEILGRQRSTRTAAGADLRTAPAAVVKMIPAKLARRYHLVPFRLRRKTLWIASTDPIDALIEDEIGLLTGCMVKSCIGLEVRIFEALESYYQVPNPIRTSALAHRLNAVRQAQTPAEAPEIAAGTSPATPEQARRPARRTEARPERRPPTAPPPAKLEYPSFIVLDAEDEALLRQANGAPEPRAVSSEAAAAAAREAAAREAAAREAVAREAVAREAVAREATAREAAAREATAREATAREAAARETAVRQAAEQEAAAREAAAREAAAREAAARKAAAREAADREAAAEVEPEEIEDRLHRAARALQHAEIRDEIADVLLEFCAPYFQRRMLLIRRRDLIVGWRGEGEGVLADMVRGIWIHTKEPSVFLSVSGTGFWLGPLPPLPPNQNLVLGLGGERPKDCVVLPITLMSKIVCYLYGDNMDQSVAGAPLAELRRLAAKAAVAFEVYILKNKIRML